jgi:hypothetical protein
VVQSRDAISGMVPWQYRNAGRLGQEGG